MFCRCGRPLDSFGHHRAACSRAGLLDRRGFAVETAAAKVCRAGARVTTNIMVRDWDLGVAQPALDGRKLALDTTLVSPVRADGTARLVAGQRDGVALVSARRLKDLTYPELVGRGARARLVVLAGEVGGRWSRETSTFLRLLAEAKARAEPLAPEESGVCLEGQVECDPGLRCRSGVCLLVADPPWRGCGWW